MSARCFVLFFFLGGLGLAQNADIRLLRTIYNGNRPALDNSMRAFSFSAYPVGATVPLGVLAHGYATHNPALIRNGYRSIATVAVAMSLSTLTKYSLQRGRPFQRYPDIVPRQTTSTYSFPSGHTTAAFATAVSLSLSYRKWYVIVPAYAYASCMAYSRMRLGVHYPSDVLGGALLGTGSGLLVWWLDKKIQAKRHPAPTQSENQ